MEYKELDIEKFEILSDPFSEYNASRNIIYKQEVYNIISCCFEVYNTLGKGFLEVVYKDALQYELKKKKIPFEREKKFEIEYKDIILPHYYCADFIVYNSIVFEVKAQAGVIDSHYKQVINYLAVSGCKLGLIVNFGEDKLEFKRVIL
jgi:GxxExxY protein